jgi:site-specific DNA-methyltransferase (adenine-specific)
MDNINLYCDDCRNTLKKLIKNDIKVDLIVTSPPYDNLRNYNNSLEWNFEIFKEIADQLYTILNMGGVIIWIVNDKIVDGSKTLTSFKQALYFKSIGFNVNDVMIWNKNNPMPQIPHNRYTSAFEYMFCFSKGKPKTFNGIELPCKNKGRKASTFKSIGGHDDNKSVEKNRITKDTKLAPNVWNYNIGGKNYGHPAIFPLSLAKDHIVSWSNPNDLVMDCFMGSGTVGVACQELNRKFIGIEKVPKYYRIAEERLKENSEQTKLL